jgi:hypothetical protein
MSVVQFVSPCHTPCKYLTFAEVVVKSLTLVLRFIKICMNFATNRSGFLYANCHYIVSSCECWYCCGTSVIHKVLYLFLLKEHWRIILALTNFMELSPS